MAQLVMLYISDTVSNSESVFEQTFKI